MHDGVDSTVIKRRRTRPTPPPREKDAEMVEELKRLHSHCIDYHLKLLSQDRFAEEELAFMKESELARTLARREEEAARKIKAEIEAARQSARIALRLEDNRKLRYFLAVNDGVDPGSYF